MKFKRLALLAFACMLGAMVLVMSGCSGDQEGDVSENNDDNTFIVGFDANFPPFGYMDESGEYTGFDLDLAKAVCDKRGWEFKAQPINWDAKDAELASGTIDCIWNGFTIQGREDDYTFTQPYMDNSQVIVVKKDSGISSFADLAGKDVEVQTDSAAEDVLSDEKKDIADTFGSLTVVPDYNTAFQDLEAGSCEAIAMDLTVANYQIDGRDDQFVILDEVLAEEQYGVGFKLGNEELRDQVEESLIELNNEGVIEDLSMEYFGYNVSTIKG